MNIRSDSARMSDYPTDTPQQSSGRTQCLNAAHAAGYQPGEGEQSDSSAEHDQYKECGYTSHPVDRTPRNQCIPDQYAQRIIDGNDDPHVSEAILRLASTQIRRLKWAQESREDVEDMAVEVVCRVYGKIGSFRGESSFKNWIIGICKYVLCEHHRQAANCPSAASFAPPDEEDGERFELPASDDPAADVENKQWAAQMYGTLTQYEATVVRLRCEEELNCREIADRCGKTHDAIRVAMSGALRKLRKRLQAQEDGEA